MKTTDNTRTIDKIMKMDMDFFGITMRIMDFMLLIVILAFGIVARVELFDIVSGDYYTAFADWMQEIQDAHANGLLYIGIEPIKASKGASTFDYNCMFQYLLCFISLFHGLVKDMYLVKLLSVAFDIISAITILRIVYEITKNTSKSMMAMGAAFILPTVVLNSAAWAQNDSIYTAFILLSFYSLLKKRDVRTWIYMALAFTLKQQAVFFLPFLIIMWMKNKTKLRYIFIIPAAYFMAVIPAWIAGRPLGSLLGTYGNQVQMFTRLSMNYPNIYTIITSDMDESIRQMIIPAGILLTLILVACLAYYIYNRNFKITPLFMVTLVVFSVELITFCLPCMHERYGYLAEVFACIYAMFGWRRFCTMIGIEVITMVTYTRYLFGSTVTFLYPEAAAMLALLLFIGYDLYRQINDNEIIVKAVAADG